MKMLLITTALCAISTAAIADETLKLRAITHVTAATSQEISDVEGHAMTLAKGVGLASFSDGGVGTASFVVVTDYTRGSGDITRVYWEVGTPDGSMLRFKGDHGRATLKGTKTEVGGPVEVTGGTGRFSGAQGSGTAVGERLQVALSSGAEIYNDFVINLKTGDQAEAAKAMLMKAVAAIKADREVALGQFNKGENGFLQGDLYPFCYRMSDGKAVAGGGTPNGIDARQATDAVGYPSGKEIYAAGLKPEGQITEIHYTLAKFGTTAPLFPKVSLVTRVDDLVCGVGYYK
jgi:hypothetical protein